MKKFDAAKKFKRACIAINIFSAIMFSIIGLSVVFLIVAAVDLIPSSSNEDISLVGNKTAELLAGIGACGLAIATILLVMVYTILDRRKKNILKEKGMTFDDWKAGYLQDYLAQRDLVAPSEEKPADIVRVEKKEDTNYPLLSPKEFDDWTHTEFEISEADELEFNRSTYKIMSELLMYATIRKSDGHTNGELYESCSLQDRARLSALIHQHLEKFNKYSITTNTVVVDTSNNIKTDTSLIDEVAVKIDSANFIEFEDAYHSKIELREDTAFPGNIWISNKSNTGSICLTKENIEEMKKFIKG